MEQAKYKNNIRKNLLKGIAHKTIRKSKTDKRFGDYNHSHYL